MASVTVIGCVQADVLTSPVTDLPSPGGTLLTDRVSVRVGGAGALGRSLGGAGAGILTLRSRLLRRSGVVGPAG